MCYFKTVKRPSIAVLINIGYEDISLRIPVWEIGVTDDQEMDPLIATYEDRYKVGGEESFPVHSGEMDIYMPKLSAVVLIARPIDR